MFSPGKTHAFSQQARACLLLVEALAGAGSLDVVTPVIA